MIRDLIYSAWHREDSISRFIGLSSAKQMSMQDIDFVEYDYMVITYYGIACFKVQSGDLTMAFDPPAKREGLKGFLASYFWC